MGGPLIPVMVHAANFTANNGQKEPAAAFSELSRCISSSCAVKLFDSSADREQFVIKLILEKSFQSIRKTSVWKIEKLSIIS